MMNIHSWSGISRRPYAKSPDGFALWIFFDFLFVWFEQQDVSCFTISLVMFLQEIKMNQREILRTTHQHLQQSLFPGSWGVHCDQGWSPVASSRKLEWRLWQHIPAWPKPSFPSCHWAMDWETGPGRWWCDPKTNHRIHVDMVYLPTWMGDFCMVNVGTWILGVMEWYETMWPKLISMSDSLFSTPVYSTDWKLDTLLHVFFKNWNP